ncbi:hypothetical protein B0H14DRAFT_2648639 [Mycena olivaceomarginata]|nr:hypothetical protein B0H14DRAFT_2648639 [Mycena olivaceomarginata]
MHLFLLAPLVWLYVASRIRAALTNRTIDDAGPLTRYIPMVDGLCIGCTSGDQLDPAQLYNGAVTTYGLQNVDLTAAIEMNFTEPGTAIYIFMAAPAEQASQQSRFALDGASTGGLFTLDSFIYWPPIQRLATLIRPPPAAAPQHPQRAHPPTLLHTIWFPLSKGNSRGRILRADRLHHRRDDLVKGRSKIKGVSVEPDVGRVGKQM